MKLNRSRQKNAFIKSLTLVCVLGPLLICAWAASIYASSEATNAEENNEAPAPVVLYADSEYTQDLTKISGSLHSDNFITKWVANAVQKALTINGMSEYDIHLKSISPLFTPEGLESYKELIDINQIEGFVENNGLHTQVILTGFPQIVAQGLMKESFYQWTVSVPVEITYIQDKRYTVDKSERELMDKDSFQKTSVEWELVLIIVRNNDVPNPYGIAFNRWIQN